MGMTMTQKILAAHAGLESVAAGQLIEETVKSVRRKKEVNDTSIQELYEDMTALYHLDQIETGESEEESFGPLPTTSIVLLASLAGAWLLIGLYVMIGAIKKKIIVKSRG